MPRKKENFLSCVYLIGFINYEKVYIGSTVRWPYRQREHEYTLNLNKHHNKYLQRVYNKRKSDFFIIPIEFIQSTNLKEVRGLEEKYISFYQSYNKNCGFNLIPFPTEGKGRQWTKKERENASKRQLGIPGRGKNKKGENNFFGKTYYLYNPEQKLVTIKNLKYFCEKNNLNYNKMHKVAYGILIEHQGWKLNLNRKNNKKKEFEFLNPNGDYVKIIGLRKFCINNNLSYKYMLQIHSGNALSHKGWKKFFKNNTQRKRKGKNYILINKDQKKIKVNNLKLFCLEQNLDYDKIRNRKESNGFLLF